MRKTTLKIPLKINLVLDVTGTLNGYHTLNSVVTAINVYDKIKLKKRRDDKIRLYQRGARADCVLLEHTAYKTAKNFSGQFKTKGVDIIIKKKIGAGGGLGGSSADIAGVAIGMNELYQTDADLYKFVTALGSDTAYMLKNGWAMLKGFGEQVESFNTNVKLYFNLFVSGIVSSSKKVYSKLDELKLCLQPQAEQMKKTLIEGDGEKAIKLIKNDLTEPAIKLNPDIEKTLLLLEDEQAFMTGSGSTIVTVHLSKAERDSVTKKHKKAFKGKIIKAESI